MADVFISFIHEEEKVATAFQRFLQKKVDKKKIFLSADQWQIFAGEVWLDRIRQELESTKVVILLLSPRSVKRPWVNFEAGAAWLTKKALIPVCFNGLLKDNLPKPYSGFQALNLKDEAYYLVRSVVHYLDHPGLPSIPPLPFWDDDTDLQELKRVLGEEEKSEACRCCERGVSYELPRVCPECQHVFRGNGWDGIDAHWRSQHEEVLKYEEFWAHLCGRHGGQT